MRKKMLAALLAACMLLLAACGSPSADGKAKGDGGRIEAGAADAPEPDIEDAGPEDPAGADEDLREVPEDGADADDPDVGVPEDGADEGIRPRLHTISAGIRSSAAVRYNGTVLFSARDYPGAMDIATWDQVKSVEAYGELTLGLLDMGQVVVAYGPNAPELDVSGWWDVVDIAAGEQFAAALKSDGTVLTGGHSGYGETDVASWTDIADIDASWQTLAGLKRDGSIVIAGYHAEALSGKIAAQGDAWDGVERISIGGSSASFDGCGHIAGLKPDGTVACVAADEAKDAKYGQWKTEDWTDIKAIACGAYHTVGLKNDGTVVTTMTEAEFPDTVRKIAGWTDIVDVAAGYGLTLGLKADGTVVYAGFDRDGQADVGDWSGIVVPGCCD